jgi:hypothetical protein
MPPVKSMSQLEIFFAALRCASLGSRIFRASRSPNASGSGADGSFCFLLPRSVELLYPSDNLGKATKQANKAAKQAKQPSKSHPTLSFHHRGLVACPAWGNLNPSWLSSP